MSKSKKRKVVKSGSPKSVLYLVGESPLVEEYAELCFAHGYEVFVQWNSSNGAQKNRAYRESNIVPPKTILALELTNIDIVAKKKNIEKLDRALPPTSAILSSSLTVTASEQSSWIVKRHRLAGFGAFPGFAEKPLVEVSPTVFTPAETIEVCRLFFGSLKKEIEIVQDRIGLVFPRIVCQIINEAMFALQEDVATPQDLDTAMKLGVNYPLGPIEWADKIGFKHVHAVLSALHQDMQEDRYRIAPLLKQMAQTGEWWKPHNIRKAPL